ncbi:hypothetical protein BGW80DRAFT_1253225 [Lactifluus volemus]|nr:hypothetical protein BGW80DRAFT_1253225 [Lactifluus volemus]
MSGRLADISRTASFFEVVVINGDLTSKVVVTVGVRVIALVFNMPTMIAEHVPYNESGILEDCTNTTHVPLPELVFCLVQMSLMQIKFHPAPSHMSLISPTSDLRQDGVKVSTQRLWYDDVQAQAIEAHYQKELVIRQTFNSSPPSQASANTLLSQNKLDLQSLEQLKSQWMIVWSFTWQSEKANTGVKRLLLQ